MRLLVLIIFCTGAFLYSADKENHEKFLEKFIGKWEVDVSGTTRTGEDAFNNMFLKINSDVKPLFGKKFLVQKSKVKGKSFDQNDYEALGLEYFFYDKKKKKMIMIQFSSDYPAYVLQLDLVDEDKLKFEDIRPQEKLTVINSFEFLKEGQERTAFFLLNNEQFNFKTEMTWLGVKVQKFKKEIKLKEIKHEEEELRKFKTPDHDWVLRGKYLYLESKKDKNYVEIIGKMITGKDIRKYQFHEDGSVKSFSPENSNGNIIWKEVDYIYEIPNP